MIQKLPYKLSITTILYGLVMGVLCIIILMFLLRIQTQFGDRVGINIGFNAYEGVTVIGSAKYVWQYGIYALLIAAINGFGIWYIQKRFTNPSIQYIIVYWIFGASIAAISLIGVYLWLVLSTNIIS
jgi:hypothetical protein